MRIENDLGNDSIKKLVLNIAIPSMLAQFVSVLYSIVDRMYIGNIPHVGDMALAGVGVCGPIITMVSSLTFLIGVGGSPLVSIKMGEGNIPAARKIMANCFLLLCIFSGLVLCLVLPLREPMLRLFGASKTILPYAKDYFTTYLSGTVFALLSVGMNQFIICQGYAKTAMKFTLLGTVLNIILDPIFIFIFHLGVTGAAIATVISQMVSCFFVLKFLFRGEIPVRVKLGEYSLRIMGKVLYIGLTPFLIVAVDNVMLIVLNAVLQKYGGPEQGDMLITCATIAQSFMLVVTMPLGGITSGTQTILGYNYGAKRADRVIKAQKYIFLLCVIYTTVMFLLARIAGVYFIRLFTRDAYLTKLTLWAIKVCTLMIIPLGVQYEIVDGFTAIGHVGMSLSLSFFRKLVYFIPIFVIPLFMEAKMVFYAEPISDILGPACSIIVYLLTMKKILRKRMQEPVNDNMPDKITIESI